MLFKLSNLNSNLALTLGYLNPALNNSALVKNRIHSPNSKIHYPQAIGHYFLWTLPSLGPSSAVEKKGKKRGQIVFYSHTFIFMLSCNKVWEKRLISGLSQAGTAWLRESSRYDSRDFWAGLGGPSSSSRLR